MNMHMHKNPHDMNHAIREASFLWGRLTATLLFGAATFAIGYFCAEARMKADPPPCKVMEKKAEAYPRTKAEMAAFIKTHREQGKGWIK